MSLPYYSYTPTCALLSRNVLGQLSFFCHLTSGLQFFLHIFQMIKFVFVLQRVKLRCKELRIQSFNTGEQYEKELYSH